MKIQIEKKSGKKIYDVSYNVKSGKKQQSGFIGNIYPIDNCFVFMIDSIPVKVITNLSEMNLIISQMFKVKPSFVNTLF